MNNSFQKNPFIVSSNVQQFNNNEFSNYAKLGHKTVEQVKGEMNQVKYGNFKEMQEKRKTEIESKPNNDFNRAPDYKSRIDNLRNINRG